MPSLESLTAAIRTRINYEQTFGRFLTLTGHGAERMAFCIFHQNTDTPAMSVNVEDGVYICRNPDCGEHGDVFTFYQRVRSLTFPEAARELAREVGLNPDDYAGARPGAPTGVGAVPTLSQIAARVGFSVDSREATTQGSREEDRFIDEQIVDAYHQRLLANTEGMRWLSEKRGLTRETIISYKLGTEGQRYTIPVRDDQNRLVNIRRYKPGAEPAAKMISWRQGFGQARLFPINDLAEGEVFLFEGEMDCLLARQMELNALTTTGGAGTWRDREWNPIFAGRSVVICYDADEAGRRGAANVAAQLATTASRVRAVVIPLAEPRGADFTDYVVGHGHTISDFMSLVERSPDFIPDMAEPVERGEPTPLHLSQASKAEYYNQPVRIHVMVSGKTTAPYLVPREVKMGCPISVRGTLDMCERCPVQQNGGPVTERIEFESNEVLQLTNVPDQQMHRVLKAKVGVPVRCGYAKSTVLEAMNVEEVQLIPEIERTDAAAPYVTRVAYYMGHGLQANRSYVMTGVTVPEPKRQLATHLIERAVESQSNIDAFQLTDDVISRLRTFSPEPGSGVEGLWRKIGEIYGDLERHTRIYQRRDLMLAIDLTMHSILRFPFQGELLVRGWCEALVIGDSRTGKSTIVQRLLDYYGAGEFSTGENTTLAGLVGGLHQIGTSWALQWGRIPLNDRRLLAIDEAGNLPTEQIGRMSAMRSSGIAEVIKVHTERTNARTRQIWITNPRSNRSLSAFSQGVLAVKELIGAPEDIARFDIVATAATGDVPLAVVNALRGMDAPATYTRDLCHQRVMWAWSRSQQHVVWSGGAEADVLRLATSQGESYRYATEIPLVEPNEQRVKLARLAASTAAIFFSASEDGQQLIVRPEHVQFAHDYLEAIYAKSSLRFDEYAEMQKRRHELAESGTIASILGRNRNAARTLMEQEQFNQRDLQEIFSYNDRDDFRDALTKLRDSGFLRRVGSSFYVKTPAAIRYLRAMITEATIQASNGNGNGDHPAPVQRDVGSFMTASEMPPDEPEW